MTPALRVRTLHCVQAGSSPLLFLFEPELHQVLLQKRILASARDLTFHTVGPHYENVAENDIVCSLCIYMCM